MLEGLGGSQHSFANSVRRLRMGGRTFVRKSSKKAPGTGGLSFPLSYRRRTARLSAVRSPWTPEPDDPRQLGRGPTKLRALPTLSTCPRSGLHPVRRPMSDPSGKPRLSPVLLTGCALGFPRPPLGFYYFARATPKTQRSAHLSLPVYEKGCHGGYR